MLFLLSKFVGAALSPGSLLLFLLAFSLAWQRRRPRTSRALLALATVFVAALSLTPAANRLIAPLERRFPPAPLPDRVDGIVVLGGAIESGASTFTHQPQLNGAAGRLTAFVALARRYPDAKLVYSGGSGSVREAEDREADVARPLFASMGLDTDRVIFERDSRNTWENAVDSKRLANPQPGQTWLLLTSSWHMPRAVGCFRKAGWTVRAYPVDYPGAEVREWLNFDFERQLPIASLAVKEWIGLAAYRALDRTDTLFPAP